MKLASPYFLKTLSSIDCAFTIGECNTELSAYRLVHIDKNSLPKMRVRLEQIHSGKVITVLDREGVSRKSGSAADGIITNLNDLALEISVADCAPVALADAKNHIVALLHSGWRGTRAGIVGNGIAEMKKLGAKSENISAYIGPAIGTDDYEVGAGFIKYFPKSTKTYSGKIFFDLKGEIERRLHSLGIVTIEKFPLSTYSTITP